MKKTRLEHGRVALGEPLPFSLYDDCNRLMLKHGEILQSQSQLDRLIERGLFFDEIFEETPQKAAERVPIYARVSELAATFEFLIDNAAPDYGGALEVAGQIRELCELDADAALANVQLDLTGRPSLRQSFRAAVLTELLLKRLGHSDEIRRHAVAGALTMNIGILDLQDLLYEQSDALTLEQKQAIVTHPRAAIKLLREQGIDHPVWLDVVEHHHEMIDGSGYPKRLLKDDLSIESQVVSLADRYCAMIAPRKHRAGLLPSIAVKELLSRQSATLDPSLATAFLKELGIYPPGTVVSLANGEVAIVVKRLLKLEHPMVRSLRSLQGIRYTDPPKRVTSAPAYAIKEALEADMAKGFDLAMLWRPIQVDEADNEATGAG
ncbi:cyclic di-GMP phosphodiesterase response regulator RpfG [mine drainage metagenome]|uniref:Cyclic di-GMP phosphodiesterase response regulator RpfG n=1 Tax=mine drainage metagenome TaxID=410659 RepID=A0A1J5Q507_9ZZZZ